MMKVFSWEAIRKLIQPHRTRDAVIRAAFKQWVDGNSNYEDRSSLEMKELSYVFRAGWIISEHFTDEPI